MLNRHRMKLVWALLIAGAVIVLGRPQAPEATTPQDDVSLRGEVMLIHGDPHPENPEQAPEVESLLLTQAGDWVPLLTDGPTDLLPHQGQTVTLSGDWVDTDPTRDDDPLVLDVDEDSVLAIGKRTVVRGTERWVNIACRFGDMPDETPRPIDYFETILENSAPGMDHYWRQTSGELVNIEGSAAYGWYDLPRSKTEYVRAASVNTGLALQMLMRDCTALAVEEDGLNLRDFGGINVMLNDRFGCCAWGGSMSLPIDGEPVRFRTTWLPPWAFNSLHVIAHEMGHGWGLPHSSGPYGQVYDSAWDVMSGGSRIGDLCRIGTEALGCQQVGTIAFHVDLLGWMPAERKVTVEPGESVSVTLDALTTARSTSDALMVQIPINGEDDEFYTVEVRTFTGYDRNLPGEAVILHHVVMGRPSPAHVVDADNNGNPNDEGAMWLPGETFRDAKSKIEVSVVGRLGTTFVVRVSNQG